MGDGRAVGGFARAALRIDMDPLLVAGRGGKGVDAFLRDGQPVAQVDFRADFGLQGRERVFPA